MKRFWNRQSPTIVLDFTRGSIKLAAAESAGEAARFRGITRIPIPRGEDTQAEPDDLEVARLIGEEVRRRGWQGMQAACLLSRSATSTQSFLFPPMSDDELRQAITLKLEGTLHFALEQASFGFRRVRERQVRGKTQVLTLVAVARKDAIERALALLQRAGLKPVAVAAAGESLANLTYYASPCDAEDATIHVDIGSASTILNLFEGRLLRFSREIDTAGEAFTRALMRPIITADQALRLTHLQAEEVKILAGYPREDEPIDLPYGLTGADLAPLLEPVAQRLTSEIRSSAQYLCGILDCKRVDYIALSGPAARMRNLDALLQESLDIPVVCIDPVARAIAHWRLAICDEDPPSPAGFSAILGYSLGSRRPINLAPEPRKIKVRGARVTRVRKALAPPVLAIGACLSLAAVPIQRQQRATHEMLLAASQRLDRLRLEEASLAGRLTRANEAARSVARARGGVPDWTAIMQELSAAFPEAAYITSLSELREEGVPILALAARLDEAPASFEARVTELVVALSASPFFRSVSAVSTTRPRVDAHGQFELRLQVAPSEVGWEPDS